MVDLVSIERKIADACIVAGRPVFDVVLIAVSKNQSDEKIQNALDTGLRVFGENRVQEALQHWKEHRLNFPDLELHLIGPLQTNKVKEAVRLFDVIETVDRPALIDALVQECNKQNKFPKFFVQVNIGNEPQKSGVGLEDLDALLDYAQRQGLDISGLMCIPPVGQDPEPYFVKMKQLALSYQLPHLSMGMSADFDYAILHGATYVRIGTALFGER